MQATISRYTEKLYDVDRRACAAAVHNARPGESSRSHIPASGGSGKAGSRFSKHFHPQLMLSIYCRVAFFWDLSSARCSMHKEMNLACIQASSRHFAVVDLFQRAFGSDGIAPINRRSAGTSDPPAPPTNQVQTRNAPRTLYLSTFSLDQRSNLPSTVLRNLLSVAAWFAVPKILCTLHLLDCNISTDAFRLPCPRWKGCQTQ